MYRSADKSFKQTWPSVLLRFSHYCCDGGRKKLEWIWRQLMESEDTELYGLVVSTVKTKSSILILWSRIWKDTVFPIIQLICTLQETRIGKCTLLCCKHVFQMRSSQFYTPYRPKAHLLQTDEFMQTYSAYRQNFEGLAACRGLAWEEPGQKWICLPFIKSLTIPSKISVLNKWEYGTHF